MFQLINDPTFFLLVKGVLWRWNFKKRKYITRDKIDLRGLFFSSVSMFFFLGHFLNSTTQVDKGCSDAK